MVSRGCFTLAHGAFVSGSLSTLFASSKRLPAIFEFSNRWEGYLEFGQVGLKDFALLAFLELNYHKCAWLFGIRNTEILGLTQPEPRTTLAKLYSAVGRPTLSPQAFTA